MIKCKYKNASYKYNKIYLTCSHVSSEYAHPLFPNKYNAPLHTNEYTAPRLFTWYNARPPSNAYSAPASPL